MKIVLAFLSTMSMLLTAHAYEQDTHLRITYLLARSVGINDETSKYLAYSDLYIDKSMITSAMLHPAQRGLFHFTGSYQPLESNAHGGSSGVLGRIKEMFWTRKVAIAERNHSVGSLLILKGLQQGDLQLIGAGLHVKQDTYGHAGFTNAWGHMFDGHNPDRAFLETEKYEDMIRSLTQSLVAIRDVLPDHMLDREGALKYLNNFARNSSLKRDVTLADLSSAPLISGVLLSSTELKRMYAENIFNNYNFKKLALKLIYEDFKSRGIINKDISFTELFPEELLRDTRMDTADTIKAVIVSDMESDFLRNKDGKDIIDTMKLFGVTRAAELMKKMEVERQRYEVRLREFENKRKQLKTQGSLSDLDYKVAQETLQKEYIELSAGLNLGNVNEELTHIMVEAPKEVQEKISVLEKEIHAKYAKQLEQAEAMILDGSLKNLSFEDRARAISEASVIAGKVVDEITEMKRAQLLEVFIKTRSRQMAHYKMSTEIADRLTKDFIPRKYNQYIKQAFETETYTRVFEVYFKDEAWRRYLSKYFGVNWVFEGGNPQSTFGRMVEKFRRTINRAGAYNRAIEKRTQRMLQREAVKLAEERIEGDLGKREQAQGISYNRSSRIMWLVKMVRFVTPAVLPFYGEVHLGKLYDLAEKNAKNHETEDMKEAVKSGKYQTPAKKQIQTQINEFIAPNKCAIYFMK